MNKLNQQKIKIVYIGTPEFAVPPLEALLASKDFEVLAVVTQEDKKVGRKQILTPPPVKTAAAKANVPVLQPNKLKNNQEFFSLLAALKPDFIVVVAYGQILPKALLDLPKYGCINVHPSLLPKYRGATPIEEALLHNDKETGVAIMELSEKLDSGKIYFIQKIPIDPKDTSTTLRAKSSLVAAKILPEVLKEIQEGTLTGIPQNDQNASYCHKIAKEEGYIDVSMLTAEDIYNRIRAYTPWPTCSLEVEGKRLKILDAEVDMNKNAQPGEIVDLSKNSIAIGTKNGLLIPKKVQLEGKPAMEIQAFLLGNRALLTKLLVNPK